MRAIIPSAGRGVRLDPSPDAPPKVMYRVCGRPLLDVVLEQTSFIPPEDTYIVVGYKKEQIVSHFGGAYHYIEQNQQLGTGHAVMMCADAFRGYDGTVLVTFGDMPLFRRQIMEGLCRWHEEHGAACTLLSAVNDDLKLWARIVRDGNGRFTGIVEGKDCTPEQARIKELFAGVVAFDSRELFRLLPLVGNNNVQHEYYLTEVPELMARQGLKVETFYTDDPDDLRGVNTREDARICEEVLARRTGCSQIRGDD